MLGHFNIFGIIRKGSFLPAGSKTLNTFYILVWLANSKRVYQTAHISPTQSHIVAPKIGPRFTLVRRVFAPREMLIVPSVFTVA